MPCECINTAIIRELEIEKLIGKIKILEKKVKKYQEELFEVYSSSNSSSAISSNNTSKINSPRLSYIYVPSRSKTPVFHCMSPV